jgi:ubiquinone/menaquinone biosynthesis C-methylase UbiE
VAPSSAAPVAARVRPDLDWRQGDAQALPFADGSFDRVVCQMVLMFFPDRSAAVREMARVVRPGGIVTLMAPATLDAQPAWDPSSRWSFGTPDPRPRT